MRLVSAVALLFLSMPAAAQIAPECADYAGPPPRDYDEGAQQDFLKNYTALMPPLGCARRLVLNNTKTEDTNIAPIIPMPSATFAFPALGPILSYAGVGYIPPIKVFGTTNVIVSAEVGLGVKAGEALQFGGRFHATSHRTVAEIATPFEEGDPAFDDLFLASTFGFDLMAGAQVGPIVPYLAAGFTDVSTFFYIGDDGIVSNNLHPYFGPNFSVGVDGLAADRFRFGGEFYAATGGYSSPDPSVENVKPGSRYGHMYTARFRLALEL